MKYDDFKIFKFSSILKIINYTRYNFLKVYKYINFKRYKYILVDVADFVILIIKYILSGIRKSINFLRYNFSKIYKNINFKRYKYILVDVADFVILIIKYILSGIRKSINFLRYNFSKIYKNINFNKYNFFNIYEYRNFRRYNFLKVYKYINFNKYKYYVAYPVCFVVFLALIYLSIPTFFNYDKSRIENEICRGFNLKCSIQGEIKYSFFPSPRIKFKNFIVQDFIDKSKSLGKINNTAIKLSFYNLFDNKKFTFTSIEFQDAKINFNLKNLDEYKKFYAKKFNLMPINLKKGEISFSDDTKHIATIEDVNLKYKFDNSIATMILKGGLLGDKIYINLKNKKDSSKIFVLKLSALNLFTEIELPNSSSDKSITDGNALFKKGKNRIAGIFDYKAGKIIVKQANLRNDFLDGKFNGEIKFSPYFDFNLNVDLNSINFNRLYSALITLNEENKKNLFKINKKINGQLNLSADKIFSKHTLINALESRLQFVNGNILVDQLLLNLGKLGAADITGVIKNDKKFTNFKFENNIFIDNLKRFYNKFGIFNKENTASNLFIAGNFDLSNLNLRLGEIYEDKKFKNEDVSYIEKEFNDLVLEDGYASLFNFGKFKEFIKLVTTETD